MLEPLRIRSSHEHTDSGKNSSGRTHTREKQHTEKPVLELDTHTNTNSSVDERLDRRTVYMLASILNSMNKQTNDYMILYIQATT